MHISKLGKLWFIYLFIVFYYIMHIHTYCSTHIVWALAQALRLPHYHLV